jgi:hypothetical protein
MDGIATDTFNKSNAPAMHSQLSAEMGPMMNPLEKDVTHGW